MSVTNEPEPQSKVSKAQKRRVGYNIKIYTVVIKKMIKKMMMIIVIKVEADVRGHPQDTKKVSIITGAGHFWECKNTEFVWQLKKTVKVAISRAVCLRECSWKANFILNIIL